MDYETFKKGFIAGLQYYPDDRPAAIEQWAQECYGAAMENETKPWDGRSSTLNNEQHTGSKKLKLGSEKRLIDIPPSRQSAIDEFFNNDAGYPPSAGSGEYKPEVSNAQQRQMMINELNTINTPGKRWRLVMEAIVFLLAEARG